MKGDSSPSSKDLASTPKAQEAMESMLNFPHSTLASKYSPESALASRHLASLSATSEIIPAMALSLPEVKMGVKVALTGRHSSPRSMATWRIEMRSARFGLEIPAKIGTIKTYESSSSSLTWVAGASERTGQ